MNRFISAQNFFCPLLLFAFSPAVAQQSSFVYMQTENNLPYTVQWNGTDYASSASGYLVLPEATPGEHILAISFSPEISESYTFTITVADKPKGFSLRQAIDNSWSLFDMVDFNLLRGTVKAKVEKPAAVIDQPVPAIKLKEGPVVKNEPPAPKKEPIIEPTNIQKIFDRSSSGGIDQVYIIVNGNKTDTIALFIPVLDEVLPKQSATNPSSFIRQSLDSSEINCLLIQGYISKRYSLSSK